MKIVIFSTHPIQYHVPWFQELSTRPELEVKVYYGCVPDAEHQGTGFDVAFNWDIPMFEGYHWEVLESRSHTPEIEGFFGNWIKGMRQVLQQDKPDLVVLTGWQALPLLQALFWCVLLGIPRVVRGESNGLKPRNWKVGLVHRLLLSQYDAFLAIGKANRLFYTGYGIDRNKIFDCPYFVENSRLLSQLDVIKNKRNMLRDQWNVPRDAVCFVYVGKLVAKKRIHDQLAALELAVKKYPNIYLLVVGTGALWESAQNIVESKQLPVTFAGFLNQTEITQAYLAADCLLLSSDYDETWGLVVNEAMVCSLPAIVSDRAGCSLDLVEDGSTGWLYPFGNVQVLADKMLAMAYDPERMREMGKKACAKVLQENTVEKAADGVVACVKAVVGF